MARDPKAARTPRKKERKNIATGVARVMHLGWFGRLPPPGALQHWIETEGADACAA